MNLLFEIGTEELPAGEIDGAVEALRSHVVSRCQAARLTFGAVETFATPRRLALRIGGLAAQGESMEETALGPAARAAFDADGKPTKAGEGFARGKGVAPEALFRVTTAKGEYVAATVRHEGRPAADVLTEALQSAFAAIPWKRSMRWGWETESFARPIHWLVALLDATVLPIRHAEVEASRTTRGHRFLAPEPLVLDGADDDYVGKLRAAFVLADVAERKALIRRGVTEAVAAEGAVAIIDEGLIAEVVHLVEWPTALAGTFDAAYTEIPREVLTTTMRTNQRYFAAERADGSLANLFCFVSNMRVRDPNVVIAGNRRVLVARLEDARFFFREDRKRSLASRLPDLERVVYIDRLGSIADRARRIELAAGQLAGLLFPGDEAVERHARRAAVLCKADLVSGVVYQFPELQGMIGRAYALADGEPAEVAQAIEAHYQPRGASEAPPSAPAAICVALADKLDTLLGCFSLGLTPSGSADPYALRRAALGVVRTCIDNRLRVPLRPLLATVAGNLPNNLGDRVGLVDEAAEFILDRLRNLLANDCPTDIAQAVVAVAEDDVASTPERCRVLNQMRQRADFDPLAAAVKRVVNILRKADDEDAAAGLPLRSAGEVDTVWFEKSSEGALREHVCNTLPPLDSAAAVHRYDEVANLLVGLKQPIDRFFDEVLVNADNPKVRNNRLALLGLVRGAFLKFADISRIQTLGS